jgi:hypothetical protein
MMIDNSFSHKTDGSPDDVSSLLTCRFVVYKTRYASALFDAALSTSALLS